MDERYIAEQTIIELTIQDQELFSDAMQNGKTSEITQFLKKMVDEYIEMGKNT